LESTKSGLAEKGWDKTPSVCQEGGLDPLKLTMPNLISEKIEIL